MDERIRKSLKYSLKDGIFASVMMGMSENFMTPYALAMKATASMVGILASMPNLIGSLIQIKSATLAERFGSRKTLISSSVFIQALLWLPIIAIYYISAANQVVWLIIVYTLFVAVGTLGFPAWSSLMADHVPATERGKVFGRRNRIFGIVNISSMLLAGIALHVFKAAGFAAIFTIAFLSRLVSWHFLTKMYEPPLTIKDEHRFTLLDFIKRMKDSNFGKFVIFISTMNFAVYLASPFFAVYMLRDLKFNYLVYTIITMTATVTILVMMNAWGAHADNVGNRRVLRLTSFFLPFIPMLWVFSHSIFYLIMIQIFAGFFWAGFNLSASNFIYDAVTPEKRTRCISYFNAINGIAMFLGAASGGYLVRVLPPIRGYNILTLFLISGILRFVAVALCSFVKEVREVKDISNLELFYSVITRKPLLSSESSMKG